jgi:hypothetical protein
MSSRRDSIDLVSFRPVSMCNSIIWPEPGLEIFLPLFAPRASPLTILSVNLSKQAHFFWGWARNTHGMRNELLTGSKQR